jgi:hypothetical protein
MQLRNRDAGAPRHFADAEQRRHLPLDLNHC